MRGHEAIGSTKHSMPAGWKKKAIPVTHSQVSAKLAFSRLKRPLDKAWGPCQQTGARQEWFSIALGAPTAGCTFSQGCRRPGMPTVHNGPITAHWQAFETP